MFSAKQFYTEIKPKLFLDLGHTLLPIFSTNMLRFRERASRADYAFSIYLGFLKQSGSYRVLLNGCLLSCRSICQLAKPSPASQMPTKAKLRGGGRDC